MEFTSILAIIGEIISVILFLCAAVNSIIIKPLQRSIDALSSQIEHLRVSFTRTDEKIDALENRVIIIEERIRE